MPLLSELEVLVVDCQATAAGPRGHLLELGWARVAQTTTGAQARLIRLPACAQIPPVVERITGISAGMLEEGVEPQVVWRELSEQAARLPEQPAPTVAHFARFEAEGMRPEDDLPRLGQERQQEDGAAEERQFRRTGKLLFTPPPNSCTCARSISWRLAH